MERAPITRQRSPWLEAEPLTINDVRTRTFRREVNDGALWALVAEEPQGWHLSISFRDRRDQLTRYPRWDEIAHARDELLPADIDFVMWLPRAGDYVALHDTTFHLHEHPERSDG
jgi:hypothetical protein